LLILAGGEGYGYKDIKKAIQQSPYRQDIIELSWIDDTTKSVLFAHAQVFVYPSYYEGFGFPILEALSYGIPVLASDIPSSREIGGNMIEYAGVDHIPQWVDALSSVLTKQSHISDIQKRKDWVKKFSFDATIEKTKQILLS
jgi:glycosyltransferase involved in cell wall biosynthesis